MRREYQVRFEYDEGTEVVHAFTSRLKARAQYIKAIRQQDRAQKNALKYHGTLGRRAHIELVEVLEQFYL